MLVRDLFVKSKPKYYDTDARPPLRKYQFCPLFSRYEPFRCFGHSGWSNIRIEGWESFPEQLLNFPTEGRWTIRWDNWKNESPHRIYFKFELPQDHAMFLLYGIKPI